MRKNDLFPIESDRSGNKLSLNGQSIATFDTLDAAEAEARMVANRAVPGASLNFELDFKWTLSDLEIRTATLERASTNEKLHDALAQRREAVKRFCRIAGLEQKLMEEWTKDTTNGERYSAWYRLECWLVAALNDWRQATDALFDELEQRPEAFFDQKRR